MKVPCGLFKQLSERERRMQRKEGGEGVFFKWTASRCQIAALEAIKTPFKSLAVHRERL